MSSVAPVPEWAAGGTDRLGLHEAWRTIRRTGVWLLARESFVRFRYGDGFSHSRALGLQLSLASVPLVIAAIGLASVLRTESVGLLLRRTLLQLTPGASTGLVRSTLSPVSEPSEADLVAILLGLAFALVSLVTAMGQLERGGNRIYGIQRDRPSRAKYGRALVMTVAAGVPAVAGFVLLVTAEAFAEATESVYDLDDDTVVLLTRPLGTLLLLLALTLVLRRSPARRQPSWPLLALGAILALALWSGLTALLAGFLHLSADIGTIYGPLTGVMALLVWSQLTAAAVFMAMAVSAQLEAAHVGRLEAADTHLPSASVRATADSG